jgi:asparagine synthase (glutamine-hydrolysing)
MRDAIVADPSWEQRLDRRGCVLLTRIAANDVSPIHLPHDMGVVLGPLFCNAEEHRRVTAVGAELAAEWCASDGLSLTQSYWGGYLAILCDRERDRVLIVRDPMGARPCFMTMPDDAGVSIVFTWFEDVLGLTPMGELDVGFVSAFLLYPRLVTTKTGLANVREIAGGECVALNRDGLVQAWTAWSPPVPMRAEASAFQADAKQLNDVVRACGRAWTGLGLPVMHRLSGGLDSSIVMAALEGAEDGQVRAGIDYPAQCPEGDEREAARAVAARFGAPLTEVAYHAERIDYARLARAPLGVKPSLADLSFADNAFAHALGGSDRLRLLSSGQGGDQVFHKADPMPGVADAIRDGFGVRQIIEVALDAARMARRSVYPPLLAGLVHSGPWPRLYLRAMLQGRFGVHRDAKRTVEEILAHPWLGRGQCQRSGQALRALLLSDVQYYHNATSLSEHAVAAPILTSQPIVEFCYALPLYQMHRGGVDRALARAAFAEVLPASSVARIEKGDTTRFHADVAKANRGYLREILLDGELVRAGMIERGEAEAMLSVTPSAHAPRGNVSAHLAAEIWLRKLKQLTPQPSRSADAPLLHQQVE